MNAELVAQVAGGLQLLQLPGMVVGQKLLGWRADLTKLAAVNRGLVLAMALGIVAYVVGTGILALAAPGALVGSELGRLLCVLQGVAWTLRVSLQRWMIGPVWPAHARWLHRVLSCIYGSLALIYLCLVGVASAG